MADGKGHFLPGKMSGFLTPWWGAPGAVIVKSPGAANHWKILFLLTQVVVYMHITPLCRGLWLGKVYESWHVSFPERGKRVLEAAPTSGQWREAGSPRAQTAVLAQGQTGHPEGWCWLYLNADNWDREDIRRKDFYVTWPLQSQGSLKATYSSSLLYMPILILVGFSLASSWNCILAILSKSLERWCWTYEGTLCQRIGECVQGFT